MIIPAALRIGSGAMLPLDAAFGLLVGVLPWAICYKLRPGSIGGGDIELMGGAGLVLGLMGALVMTFLSCAFYLGAYLFCKKKGGGIPFGPYIAAGGIIAFLLIR